MDALFLHLLNTALSATWLVLAILLLRPLLKKTPGWLSCALWGLLALRLMMPFSLESALSLVPSADPIPETIVYASGPAIDSGLPVIDSVGNQSLGAAMTPGPGDSVNPIQIVLQVCGWVWLLGVAVMLGCAAFCYLRLRRGLRDAAPLGNGVYRCRSVTAPFVLGLFRPKIYLPTQMDAVQTECVLAHERSHIARLDHWWKLLGYGLLTVYWFHPLLWMAYVLLGRDIELACDERVIRTYSREQTADYMQTLLSFSTPRRFITACPLAFGEVGVKKRIQKVLCYKKAPFWVAAVCAVLVAILAVCFLTDPVTPEAVPTAEEIIWPFQLSSDGPRAEIWADHSIQALVASSLGILEYPGQEPRWETGAFLSLERSTRSGLDYYYGVCLYQGYIQHTKVREVLIPCRITKDDGAITEFWRPRDPTAYGQEVREVFSEKLADYLLEDETAETTCRALLDPVCDSQADGFYAGWVSYPIPITPSQIHDLYYVVLQEDDHFRSTGEISAVEQLLSSAAAVEDAPDKNFHRELIAYRKDGLVLRAMVANDGSPYFLSGNTVYRYEAEKGICEIFSDYD